jgi:ubiquinone/menaquinone biosynthesis C-methylase UbiE
MPDHTNVYNNEAEKYDLLISKQPKLDELVEEIRPFAGLDIVDLGSGTGRLATVLAPKAKSIVALDSAGSMLQIAANKLKKAGLANWTTKVADNKNLPLDENSADLIVVGWSICYLASSNVPNNEQNIEKVIQEMKRVLRHGGTIIILETMGTGNKTPNPPDFLKQYYSLLENVYGFSHKCIRIDYNFDSLGQAAELSRFFFGDELAEKVLDQKLVNLPEYAGVWWIHVK